VNKFKLASTTRAS